MHIFSSPFSLYLFSDLNILSQNSENSCTARVSFEEEIAQVETREVVGEEKETFSPIRCSLSGANRPVKKVQ